MPYPSLTNIQRAYLFRREAFLTGITERAGRLFEDGYQVTDHPFEAHIFCVYKKDGTSYDINPVRGTCTCPFYKAQKSAPLDSQPVACKHLVGLERLVLVTLAMLQRAGKLHSYRSLADAWDAAQEAREAEGK